jgi:hypothetical protein
MYDNIPASLPKEFFYNISKLSGSYSKNLIKVTADRVDASPNTISVFRLPIGSLLDLRSLSVWFKTTLSGTNPTIPARYSSSFIKRMAISCNNVVIAQIEDYNLLYNLMADHNNKALNKGIGGEFLDNTIIWGESSSTGTDQVALSAQKALLGAVTNQSDVQMVINNFLSFLGSSSTQYIPSDKFGEITLSITWAPVYEVLGGTAEASTVTYTNNSYAISDLYLTCEAISFSDDSYYNSINSKDLMYSFDDYTVTRFAETTKTSGINVTTYLNANSIDWVACTAVRNQTTPKLMVGWGSRGAGDGTTDKVASVYEYLSDPVAYVNNVDSSVNGDGFFSTEAMVRDLQGIKSAQFSINNKALNYSSLNKYEIFQNNLCALGYEGIDASSNGLVNTCVSIFHYFKYYGAVFQSLSLIDKDQYYISGLSSAGSSCAVNAVINFDSDATYKITPVIIAKMTKVLHVKNGRQITVE